MKDWLRDHPYGFTQHVIANTVAYLTLGLRIKAVSPEYLPNLVQEFGLKHFKLETSRVQKEGDSQCFRCWKAPLPDLPKDNFYHDYYKFSVTSHEITIERLGCHSHVAEVEIGNLIRYLLCDMKLTLDYWELSIGDADGSVFHEETGHLDSIFRKWLEL